MHHIKQFAVCLFLLTMTAAAPGLSGCASDKHQNTVSLLSAAGFHTMAPATPQQWAAFNALPPNKVERQDFNGKVIYAYADKNASIVYVGGEAEYQQFQLLGHQQRVSNQQLQAAQMNQSAAMNWNAWGPRGMRW